MPQPYARAYQETNSCAVSQGGNAHRPEFDGLVDTTCCEHALRRHIEGDAASRLSMSFDSPKCLVCGACTDIFSYVCTRRPSLVETSGLSRTEMFLSVKSGKGTG